MCRGPGDANKTCQHCGKVLGTVQSRKNHERYPHAEEALWDGLIVVVVVHQVEQPTTAPCLTPANKQLRILSVLQTTHDRTLAVAAQRKRANST